MQTKALAHIEIETVNEDQRIVRGIATTNAVDRVGDIIEPLGVTFAAKVPLLSAHKHDQTVGTVVFDTPARDGVRFEAKLPKITEPGPLKDRVDTAWGELKHGLVNSVSIGFRPIDGQVEALPSGGLRYKKIEIFELSLVSVPANPDAQVLELRANAPKRTARSNFIGSAERRKARGNLIADEKRYLRRTRNALVARMGEKAVPRFKSLAELDAWDDARLRAAFAKGKTICLTHEEITSVAPSPVPQRVVKL